MKRLDLPTGADKPSWGGLFGTATTLYIFWDPYQKNAAWPEWLWTSLAFFAFLSLAILGAIYWSRKDVMRRVCIALALVAIAFTAYRPSGIIFFVFVAAFAPLAMRGDVVGSAVTIAGVVGLIVAEWWLFWPQSWMPYIVAIEAFLVGGAITVVIRQQMGLRRILKTSEQERIARDLHDILGHTLSVIILKSELASRLLDQDPQRAKAEIEDVERISRNALGEVREAIVGYRMGNLRAEIDRAKSTLETLGISVEHQCDPISLPVAYERTLALIVREAVTNVVRHAKASRCSMALREIDGVYRLEVRDDGRGGLHQEGMGMRGVRERVAAIGGEVVWNTTLGTELIITVPIPATHATQANE